MAVALGKLAICAAGLIGGSYLTKEGSLSDVTSFFSGTLKIITKHLQQDKDNSQSSGKSESESLLAQVYNLQQELRLLASSRSVTIVTSSRSGSGTYGVTTIVVVGVMGYGYIWWKGWNLSDMMFVTRRGFSDACTKVANQLDLVSSSVSSARRYLSTRIDSVDSNLTECLELTAATRDEVSELHGEVSEIHLEVESIQRVVETLVPKLDRIEESQELATQGVYKLCKFVQGLEQGRNTEHIQELPSGSRPALELPQCRPITMELPSGSRPALELPQCRPITMTGFRSPLVLEASSLSASTESPKVLRPPAALSASALKELQGISHAIKASSPKPRASGANTQVVPFGVPSFQERSSNSSSSRLFGWKLPSMSILARTRSDIS